MPRTARASNLTERSLSYICSTSVFRIERDNFRSARLQVSRPTFHHHSPLLEHVGSGIGGFGLILDNMGKRGLGNLAREIGLLLRPCAERRAESVNMHVKALFFHQLGNRHVG